MPEDTSPTVLMPSLGSRSLCTEAEMLVLKIERVLGGLGQSQIGGWVVPSSAGMPPQSYSVPPLPGPPFASCGLSRMDSFGVPDP